MMCVSSGIIYVFRDLQPLFHIKSKTMFAFFTNSSIISLNCDQTITNYNNEELIDNKPFTAQLKLTQYCSETQMLATANDMEIEIYNANTLQKVIVLKRNVTIVTSMKFSDDGEYLLSGSEYGQVILWHVKTGDKIKVIEAHSNLVSSVSLKQYILQAGFDQKIKLFNIFSKQPIKILEGHTSEVMRVLFTHDKKFVVSCGMDSCVIVWSASDGKLIKKLQHYDKITFIQVSSCDKFLISAEMSQHVRIWDLQSGKCIHSFKLHLSSVDFRSNNFIVCSQFGECCLFNVIDSNHVQLSSNKNFVDLIKMVLLLLSLMKIRFKYLSQKLIK
ncbi:Notchless [Hexamita inflata]|uniref:Notchless n=1 Tax=Hexamita inflata TaxID=28002 RepID=A0ABP1HX35_9EUKA